jgi:hypothetical protein
MALSIVQHLRMQAVSTTCTPGPAVRRRLYNRSSPVFPVKAPERMRHCSGIAAPSAPARRPQGAEPGPQWGVRPAGEAARMPWPALGPTAPSAGSVRHRRVGSRAPRPRDGGSLWSGGGPPQTPPRPTSRAARPAEAGAALADAARAPRAPRPATAPRRARGPATRRPSARRGGGPPHHVGHGPGGRHNPVSPIERAEATTH